MSQAQATILRRRPAVLPSIAAAGLIVVAGCGDGRLPTYPVTGTVVVDGQPAPNALLIFCPIEGQDPSDFTRLRPVGETGPDGNFEVTTYEAKDGAPAGKYQVMVRWEAAPPGAEKVDRSPRAKRPRDRLGGRYMNPQTSGLEATVEEGPTELPPFQLKSK